MKKIIAFCLCFGVISPVFAVKNSREYNERIRAKRARRSQARQNTKTKAERRRESKQIRNEANYSKWKKHTENRKKKSHVVVRATKSIFGKVFWMALGAGTLYVVLNPALIDVAIASVSSAAVAASVAISNAIARK